MISPFSPSIFLIFFFNLYHLFIKLSISVQFRLQGSISQLVQFFLDDLRPLLNFLHQRNYFVNFLSILSQEHLSPWQALLIILLFQINDFLLVYGYFDYFLLWADMTRFGTLPRTTWAVSSITEIATSWLNKVWFPNTALAASNLTVYTHLICVI